MLQSKLFYKTEKPAQSASRNEAGENLAISHQLLVNAGFVDQLMAGVYTFLPLGFKVLQKIENIIRKNMREAGGQEILMPVLQPKENWVKTGRWEKFDVLFKIKGSGGKEYALGPTHEEVISPLAKKIIFSYKDLPFSVFQIQTKFRDELRAKSGILRTREFLMKDLYSFHTSQQDLDVYFSKMAKVYKNIFKSVGLGNRTYETLASGGSFSKHSYEFQTATDAGEDVIYVCKKCGFAINKEIKTNDECPNCKKGDYEEKKAVEVGNIFKLGAGFSEPFGLTFRDKDGAEKPVLMGCYGIGLSRLMGAIVEVNHDEKGIVWPKSVAPFLAHLIAIEKTVKVERAADKIYESLSRLAGRGSSTASLSGLKNNIEVLYDDRQDRSAGEKFAETDLIGIPYRVVVSEKTLAKNSVEVKERSKKETKLVGIKQLLKFLNF